MNNPMNVYKTGPANVIFADFPDVDVIRVDDTYYMVSTTMHFMPGCVILRSYNLLDWEICSYVFDELEKTDGQTLCDNKGIYGQGMWAASLRFHDGKFYVCFVANDTHKTYLFTSEKIEGPWKKSEIQGFYHDMSLLFDDDGRVFTVSGNTEIRLIQMKSDLSGPLEGGINKVIIKDDKENVNLGYEGSHFYKINGKYYIFLIHLPKGKMRTEACFVSDMVDGEYKGGDVLCADFANWNSGLAQGGIVQSNDGKFYAMLFQDHGALGRIPFLMEIKMPSEKLPGWAINQTPGGGKSAGEVAKITPTGKNPELPIFPQTVPAEVTVLDNRPGYNYQPLFSDSFCDENGKLNSCWQWNHIPEKSLIKLSKSEYRLKTGKIVVNPVQAANTLTQRIFTEHCTCTATVDASKINEGDFAGLCALEGEYGFIALTKKDGKFKIVVAEHKIPYSPWTMKGSDSSEPNFIAEIPCENPKMTFTLDFNLEKDRQEVTFYYAEAGNGDCACDGDEESLAGRKIAGRPVKLRYTLDQFVGVRAGLFLYSTEEVGGEAEVSGFQIIV